MKQKSLIALLAAVCIIFAACAPTSENSGSSLDTVPSVPESSSSSEPAEPTNLLAHWKFQNVEGCYTGNIDTDDLTFIDLTGNGNDMVVEYEGNGDELDIFTWDVGVSGEGSTSLKFNNTLALAEIVDPYNKSETTYSGAYVSGKYLETVGEAPINFFTGSDDWTIELIFKVSSDWNNAYNRYTGIFSRQGIVPSEDEPVFSMAISAAADSVSGAIGLDNAVGLQLLHTNENASISNDEFSSLKAETWVHYMVVGTGNKIMTYVNGECVKDITKNSSFYWSDFGWEVGVGRKSGAGEQSMNTQHPEGMIRRLFCGSISEIRFSSDALTVADSLWEILN